VRLVSICLFCDATPEKKNKGLPIMSYTAADLTKVQAAIVALAEGTRVVSVTVNGKTIQYSPAQIKELQTLRDSMQTEIGSTATRRRFVLTQTEKGL